MNRLRRRCRRLGIRVATLIFGGVACALLGPMATVADSYHVFLCCIPYGPSPGRAAPTDDVTYSTTGIYQEKPLDARRGPAWIPHYPYHYACWIAIMAVLALTFASVARAGTYVINNCPSAPVPNGDAGPWTVWGAPQTAKNSCSGGPGDYIAPRGETMGPNTSDGVNVIVPSWSGITIVEARVWWAVPKKVAGADAFANAGTTNGVIFEVQTPFERTESDFTLPSTTTGFDLENYCSSDHESQGCEFGVPQANDLQMFGAQLKLSDDRLPAGSVTGGGLASTGTVSGMQSLAYNAEDADSGVRLAQLLVDGQVVAENNYITECPYTDFAACPNTESSTLMWNTTGVSNGSHEVALRIFNAANNSITLDDHLVTVENQPIQSDTTSIGSSTFDNSGSGSGGSGSTVGRIANGEPCAGEELSLQINGKTKPPVVPYGEPVTVKGVLHCSSAPIRNARIAIGTLGGPPSIAITDTVQTSLDGSFSYQVPSGPDRVLVFTYTAYNTDPGPSATATVPILVRPTIRLHIAPRRTSNGHTIRWNGTISGGPFPRQGVALEVEVREARHWKVFDQAIANSQGIFHYAYRFHATIEPTNYTFRVALPDTGAGDYPYSPGASNTVEVHVAP
jgi:hypothetical protein